VAVIGTANLQNQVEHKNLSPVAGN